MKKALLILTAICAGFLFSSSLTAEEVTLDHVKVKVFYSPDGGCTDALIQEINDARGEILVQAYSFTSKKIAKALVHAFKRNVDVEIVLDEGQKHEKKSMASYLSKKGLPVYLDGKHHTAHNKVMVIDGSTVITGSFNLIEAAEKENAENLLIIPAEELADLYKANWEKHKEHSKVYKH